MLITTVGDIPSPGAPLREWLEPGGRVALFQGTDDVPAIDGIGSSEVHRLPRGASNFLVVLTFHVKQ